MNDKLYKEIYDVVIELFNYDLSDVSGEDAKEFTEDIVVEIIKIIRNEKLNNLLNGK